MRKRITVLMATLMLALTMAFGSVAVAATTTSQSFDDGVCTTTTTKGANVTTTTSQGQCESSGKDRGSTDSKAPPGQNR